MVCQACGSEVATDVRFCSKCGAQVVGAAAPQQQTPPPQYAGHPSYPQYPQYPPMVAAPRVQRHLQTLGTLWCVYGVYRVLSGLAGMFFIRTFAWRHFGGYGPWGNFGMHGPGWMALLPVIATITVIAAALALLTGFSLLTRKPWGRTLAIVLAVLSLLRFPVGTALGIYTLWVLAPGASGMEYDAIADRS